MASPSYYEALADKIKIKLEKVDQKAAAFADTLDDLADVLDADYSKIVRLTVLKLYRNIIMRSPVDTGAYRASHGIAVGNEPNETEGLKGSQTDAELEALEIEMPGIDWELGDGTIWIYNNQPYAGALEVGHSQQAPSGVYAVALAEFESVLKSEIKKAKVLE